MKYFYNRIHLLCAYKMMKSDWSAWTEESYASQMAQLTQDDLEYVMLLDEEVLIEMENECLTWYNENN